MLMLVLAQRCACGCHGFTVVTLLLAVSLAAAAFQGELVLKVSGLRLYECDTCHRQGPQIMSLHSVTAQEDLGKKGGGCQLLVRLLHAVGW